MSTDVLLWIILAAVLAIVVFLIGFCIRISNRLNDVKHDADVNYHLSKLENDVIRDTIMSDVNGMFNALSTKINSMIDGYNKIIKTQSIHEAMVNDFADRIRVLELIAGVLPEEGAQYKNAIDNFQEEIKSIQLYSKEYEARIEKLEEKISGLAEFCNGLKLSDKSMEALRNEMDILRDEVNNKADRRTRKKQPT